MSVTPLVDATQADPWNEVGTLVWAIEKYKLPATQPTSWSTTDEATYGTTPNDWDVSEVTDFSSLFMHTGWGSMWGSQTDKSYDVSNWDVSAGTNFSSMVSNNTEFDYDISVWAVSSTATLTNMFSGATLMINNRGFSATPSSTDFNQGSSVTPITQSNIQTAVAAWIGGDTTTYGDIKDWDVSQVTSMYRLFYNKSNFNDDISNWNVSNVTSMKEMFRGASNFNQDISGWNVSSVTTMNGIFYQTSNFNQDISGWDVSNVTDMRSMFYSASAFNNGDNGNNQAKSLNNWDVSKVTDMSIMFRNALAFNQDISGWDVSSVANMDGMFTMSSGTSAFNQNISGWDVSSVTTMRYMFSYNTTFDQPTISNWNTVSVTVSEDVNVDGYYNMFTSATKMLNHFPATPSAADFSIPTGLVGELQAIDNNDTAPTLSNASDNKKRLAIALAKLT